MQDRRNVFTIEHNYLAVTQSLIILFMYSTYMSQLRVHTVIPTYNDVLSVIIYHSHLGIYMKIWLEL
jgi:hypothetical protein